MAKKKTGLPKSLEEDREILEQQSPEEFAKEFFGDLNTKEPQLGDDGKPLPTLEWLKEHYKTKSAAIRYLHFLGNSPKTISKHLGILYQHARNVCTTPLKRGPNEDWRPPKAKTITQNPTTNDAADFIEPGEPGYEDLDDPV